MKQLIFTLLTTFCLTTLPSASTPRVVGLDDAADVKSSAAQAASIPVVAGNAEVDRKVTDAEVSNFNPYAFLRPYLLATNGPTGFTVNLNSQACIAALKKIIAKGLDINQQGPQQGPSFGDGARSALLHIVSNFRDTQIIHFLIEAGADLDALDNLGRTPAHCANFSRRSDNLMVLMQAGANMSVRYGEWKQTILEIIGKNRGCEPTTPVVSALVEVTMDNIEELISETCNNLCWACQPRACFQAFKQRIQTGLRYRAQYTAHLPQQLALIREAIPTLPRQMAEYINRLAGRPIYFLLEAQASEAANPA